MFSDHKGIKLEIRNRKSLKHVKIKDLLKPPPISLFFHITSVDCQ